MDAPDDRIVEALESGTRVLVTRLQYLGDVILTLPLVDAIKRRYPRTEVDYLCRPPAAGLLADDSRFARVFTLRPDLGIGASIKLISILRKRRYGVVIDLYSNPRSAWISRFTGAKVRIGGDRRGRRYLYTRRIAVPRTVRSAIEFHMRYLGPTGIGAAPAKPVFTPSAEDQDEAVSLLEAHGLEVTGRPEPGKARRPVIGVHPGGKWVVKRWPIESFTALLKKLEEKWNARVVLLTGPGEEVFTNNLAKASGEGTVCLPAVAVRTVAALIAQFDAMVVGDGGILHLSVAVNTPTVGIFGSSEPDVWFPYEPFGPFLPAYLELPCRPCHQHVCPLGHLDCLNKLSPDSVLGKLAAVLGKSTRRGNSRAAL